MCSMASLINLTSIPRISPRELSKILLSEISSANVDAPAYPIKLAIVDVRDSDHIGGHIKNSIHAPSATLDKSMPDLVNKLKDKEKVIFHCALSQQRGPSAALKYLRERERLLGIAFAHGQGVDGHENSKLSKGQQIYILDQGFVGWQKDYGEDVRLTEGYRKEIWI